MIAIFERALHLVAKHGGRVIGDINFCFQPSRKRVFMAWIFSSWLVGIGALQGQSLNKDILTEAEKYEGGGYKWRGTGAHKDLLIGKHCLLRRARGGTHCSGYTFGVVFEVLKKNNLLGGIPLETAKRFQKEWYGSTPESRETLSVYALQKLNRGKKIAHHEAQPGDFVQFWRNNNTGHSVIFVSWIKDGTGKITGLNYRSSQEVTNGISNRTENIGLTEKDINLKRLYIARLLGSGKTS